MYSTHPIIELRTKLLSGLSLLTEVLKIPNGLQQAIYKLNENTTVEEVKKLRDENIDTFFRSAIKDSQERKDISTLLKMPIQKFLSNTPQDRHPSESEIRLNNLYRHRKQIIEDKNIIQSPGARPSKLSSTPKIYLDMDGVITSFINAVKKLGDEPSMGLSDDASEKQKQTMYKAIDNANTSFWSEMQWTSDGMDLWKNLKQYNPTLLSSPGEFRSAPAGKQEWVNQNIPGTPLIVETDKWKYAERGALLIDDTKNNVGAWEEAGGIGIHHTDATSTIQKLTELINTKPILTLAKVPTMKKLSNEIRRIGLLLKLASELTQEEIVRILGKLLIMINNRNNFAEPSKDRPMTRQEHSPSTLSELTLSENGIKELQKYINILEIKEMEPNKSSLNIAIDGFMEAMRISGEKSEEIKDFYNYLLKLKFGEQETREELKRVLNSAVRNTNIYMSIRSS